MKLFVALGLLISGLALLVFNNPIARGQKYVDEVFGMGSVSLRFNRIVFCIVGILLAALGILVLLGILKLD